MPFDGCLHRGDEPAGGFERVGDLLPGDVDEVAVVGVKSRRSSAEIRLPSSAFPRQGQRYVNALGVDLFANWCRLVDTTPPFLARSNGKLGPRAMRETNATRRGPQFADLFRRKRTACQHEQVDVRFGGVVTSGRKGDAALFVPLTKSHVAGFQKELRPLFGVQRPRRLHPSPQRKQGNTCRIIRSRPSFSPGWTPLAILGRMMHRRSLVAVFTRWSSV